MVSSTAKTVDAYLAELPAERREVVAQLRQRILKHLPKGFEEMMLWGMPVYAVPLSRYPNTYNKQPLAYTALAAQKNAYSLYLNMAYADNSVDRAFRAAFAKAGKKLDMGKSCVRFKKLDDLVLEAVDQAVASTSLTDFLDGYERVQGATKTSQRKATAASKPPAKPASIKKAGATEGKARTPPGRKAAAKVPAKAAAGSQSRAKKPASKAPARKTARSV